jgi:excisionase family DNA binding protein
MSTLHDRRIEPSDISPDILRQIENLIHHPGRPALVGPDKVRIELPEALNDLLVFVVEAMKRKQAIVLLPEDEAFTTQAAADYLGMSRPYLLRLLEAGKIPYHFVGTHRRIMFRDLRAFQEGRDKERRAKLDTMTRALDEAGVYDRF